MGVEKSGTVKESLELLPGTLGINTEYFELSGLLPKKLAVGRNSYHCTPDISSISPSKELTPRTQRREHERDAGPKDLHVFQVVAQTSTINLLVKVSEKKLRSTLSFCR